MTERAGLAQFMGKGAPVLAPDIHVRQTALEFSTRSLAWEFIPIPSNTARKVRIITAAQSISSEHCCGQK